MQHKVIISAIIVDDNGGVEVQYSFDDGGINNATFADMTTMLAQATDPIDNPPKGLMMALAWWLARDPDASNQGLILNKKCFIDFGDPLPIKVIN